MNFEEKAKIRKNYVLFKEHILFGGKSSTLLDHLCASDVITTDDYERILSEGISPEKVQRLLRVLETKKTPGCLNKFCEALDKSGHDFLAKAIRETEVDPSSIEKGTNHFILKLNVPLHIGIKF